MATNEDLKMLPLKKIMYIKIDVLDKSYKTVEVIEGNVTSGGYNFNADSDVRKTSKLDICLTNCDFDFNDTIFFNYYLRIYIGYHSFFSKKILYYSIGVYSFDKNSYTYDAQNNSLSLDLADLTVLMDADHKGTQYGALTPCIYAVNPETGQRYDRSQYPERIILKRIVIGLLENYGITRYRVDDIGIHNKQDTDEYAWDELPYDLEFSTGTGLLEILNTIKTMYPYYEFFFDNDGVFVFQEKSCLDEDPIVLDEKVIDNLVVSENKAINTYDIKNVVEVWGNNYDMKDGRFANSSTYASNVYSISFDNYTETGYADGMLFAVNVTTTNSGSSTYLKINSLDNKLIYDKSSGDAIPANTLIKDNVYVFEYSTSKGGFYYLGSYQIHAVSILTDGTMNSLYANETERLTYFAARYNTNNVSFIEDEENPYCIERIGEIVKIFQGDKFANLDMPSMAVDYANDKLDRLCRRINSLTLEMTVIPWLDVNQKIKYTPQGETTAKVYLTKTISGDLMSGKMSVTIEDFYASLDEE